MSEKNKYLYIKTEPIKTIADEKQIQDHMRMNNWLAITYLFMLYRHDGSIEKFSKANQEVFYKKKNLYKCPIRMKLRDNLVTLWQHWDQAKKLPVIKEDPLGVVNDSHMDFDLHECYNTYMEDTFPDITYFDTHQMITDCLDEDGNVVNYKELQNRMVEELQYFLESIYQRTRKD